MNLILTISIGQRPWTKLTIPLMKKYAEKHGYEFKLISDKFTSEKNAKEHKCSIYQLLDTYDRILYLDDTCIIHPKCPDLFNLVSENLLGVLIESPTFFELTQTLKNACMTYNGFYDDKDIRWFNSGVMVISRQHKEMFLPSKFYLVNGFFDQAYFNATRIKNNIEIYDLTEKYNYLGSMIRKNKNLFDIKNDIFIYHLTRSTGNRIEVAKKLYLKVINE